MVSCFLCQMNMIYKFQICRNQCPKIDVPLNRFGDYAFNHNQIKAKLEINIQIQIKQTNSQEKQLGSNKKFARESKHFNFIMHHTEKIEIEISSKRAAQCRICHRYKSFSICTHSHQISSSEHCCLLGTKVLKGKIKFLFQDVEISTHFDKLQQKLIVTSCLINLLQLIIASIADPTG